MNEHQIRWDDLQIVAAVAETGTLSGAGKKLGISHATVFRRLNSMEERLGVELFERSRSGYSPSPAGEDLFAVAQRMEQDITDVERRLAGQDLKLSGSVRVTTTDTLFKGVLAPLFQQFRKDYPDISLEIVISNQLHSLSKREADIAMRPTSTPPETLIGRKAGVIQQAVYGSRNRWSESALAISELRGEDWVGPDIHMGNGKLEGWMSQQGLSNACAYRIDSMLGMWAAVKAGSGIAILPCYLGESDNELVRLTHPVEDLAIPLWILTHPDLKRVKRIREFTRVMGDALRLKLNSN
ncbi:LysR family transcriptional regulator [Marinobacter sp. CHS3-4]|uniref:LysR family transcriptional regulator n=1 Tax=Marinobacter sp. CHS3-4 TaxID=3045174 RepID=UPI0024B5F372|nr:LysR family transcriptional regulator [Marinobacter sp. CHS3-4]MDI9246435.1 LysR family transcriptional regulator [Marinobacter sp. CHS3-4]